MRDVDENLTNENQPGEIEPIVKGPGTKDSGRNQSADNKPAEKQPGESQANENFISKKRKPEGEMEGSDQQTKEEKGEKDTPKNKKNKIGERELRSRGIDIDGAAPAAGTQNTGRTSSRVKKSLSGMGNEMYGNPFNNVRIIGTVGYKLVTAEPPETFDTSN